MQAPHTVHCTLIYHILKMYNSQKIIKLENEQAPKHFNIMQTSTVLDNKITDSMQMSSIALLKPVNLVLWNFSLFEK